LDGLCYRYSRSEVICLLAINSKENRMFSWCVLNEDHIIISTVACLFVFADKMAKRLLARVAFSVVLLVALSVNTASACSCMLSHPQTHACRADFGKDSFSITSLPCFYFYGAF
jgi:hypothetical protein